MATQRHSGRLAGTSNFAITGTPESYDNFIFVHGSLSRIMRAKVCPCGSKTGNPDIFCSLCHGDGYIYDFQRKYLVRDTDCDMSADGTTLYPWLIPILSVQKVERLISAEQGGIVSYNVDSFTANHIKISGSPLPKPWQKMRISYEYDRFTEVTGDEVLVDRTNKILTTTKTLYDGEHQFSNYTVHSDIGQIIRVYNADGSHTYTKYTFRKNKIYLDGTEPTPPAYPGVLVDYYYVPLEKVLIAGPQTKVNREEPWQSMLVSGELQAALYSKIKIGMGDIITPMFSTIYRDEVVRRGAGTVDKLLEFDLEDIDEEIFDENGKKYLRDTHYILTGFRDLKWLGSTKPAEGVHYSVRYGYHPTFTIFIDNSEPNRQENRFYPNIVKLKVWSRTLHKDIPVPDKEKTAGELTFNNPFVD